MATQKGTALAVTLHRLGCGPSWRTDGVCSTLARQAARFTTLTEEECSGPRWSWNYAGDWTARLSVADFQRQNAAALERAAKRITATVADLPPTEYGPVRVALGGDPRGYVVRLLVPTAPGEITPVGIDGAGHGIMSREAVTA
jgi:hypothetical protein